jgi:hypothetical protein
VQLATQDRGYVTPLASRFKPWVVRRVPDRWEVLRILTRWATDSSWSRTMGRGVGYSDVLLEGKQVFCVNEQQKPVPVGARYEAWALIACTLRSWVRTPLKAWMIVHVFVCVCVCNSAVQIRFSDSLS